MDEELGEVDSLDRKPADWSGWHPDLHRFLNRLHQPDMTLESAKMLWTDYKKLVKSHAELAAVLPIMFRKLSPYLYLDHLEALYADIVETGQLTTSLGRDMLRHYMKKDDLENAKIVVNDLKAANLDVSGSTISMMLRLYASTGNAREMWRNFDSYVQREQFQNQPYPYLCGSLFTALGRLGTPQDRHITGILQLMVSGEEYYPNAPQYYDWLAEQNLTTLPSEGEVPDFPSQAPVRLPLPDSFCFSMAFSSISTLDAAQFAWELAQRCQVSTSTVTANYIICIAPHDIKEAIRLFTQFISTPEGKKTWAVNHKLRKELAAHAAHANDIPSLLAVLDEKHETRHVTTSDIVSVLGCHIRLGKEVAELIQLTAELAARYQLSTHTHLFRGLILELLYHNKPYDAEAVLQHIIDTNITMHFHHWTPIPLWYLSQWTEKLAAGNADQETLKVLEDDFNRMNEKLLKSKQISGFYVRMVVMWHPNNDYCKKFIDRVIQEGVEAKSVIFSLTQTTLKYNRGISVVNHLLEKHQCHFSPFLAQKLIEWAAKDKRYRECFFLAQKMVKVVKESEGKTWIVGEWVVHFIDRTLAPLGIQPPIRRFYQFYKYPRLSEGQLIQFEAFLTQWERVAKRRNFVPLDTPSTADSSQNPPSPAATLAHHSTLSRFNQPIVSHSTPGTSAKISVGLKQEENPNLARQSTSSSIL